MTTATEAPPRTTPATTGWPIAHLEPLGGRNGEIFAVRLAVTVSNPASIARGIEDALGAARRHVHEARQAAQAGPEAEEARRAEAAAREHEARLAQLHVRESEVRQIRRDAILAGTDPPPGLPAVRDLEGEIADLAEQTGAYRERARQLRSVAQATEEEAVRTARNGPLSELTQRKARAQAELEKQLASCLHELLICRAALILF